MELKVGDKLKIIYKNGLHTDGIENDILEVVGLDFSDFIFKNLRNQRVGRYGFNKYQFEFYIVEQELNLPDWF